MITGSYLSDNIPINEGIISVSGDSFSVYMNNNTFNNLSLDSIVTINGGDLVEISGFSISEVTSTNGGQ